MTALSETAFNRFWSSPIALLLVTGGMVGLMLPLGKMATGHGVAASIWAFVISFGAGAALFIYLRMKGERLSVTGPTLKYYTITAAISYALPNYLMFTIIQDLGAGYVGIMLTLSPVFTLLMSLLFRVQPPSALGIVGIVIGFIGAALVASAKADFSDPLKLLPIGLGLLIPFSLAAGNIYRTAAWPAGASPVHLAAGSHLASALLLFIGVVIGGNAGDIPKLVHMPWLVVFQVVSAAILFGVFFRLQEVGGPVYLSQIGYVAAAIGLVSGIFFLAETYAFLTWLGVLVIVLGVSLTTKAQKRR